MFLRVASLYLETNIIVIPALRGSAENYADLNDNPEERARNMAWSGSLVVVNFLTCDAESHIALWK